MGEWGLARCPSRTRDGQLRGAGYPTGEVGIDPAVTQIIGRRTPAPAPAGAGWASNRRAFRNLFEKISSVAGVRGSGRSATQNSMSALMFL
jgi:hypothetical protein